MKNIRGLEQACIMMQAQNESASLGIDRDYSLAANKLFVGTFQNRAIGFKKSGTWTQAFSKDTPATPSNRLLS